MLWIQEVEMVDSVDEFGSSGSIEGKDFPNLGMLDARIASALNNIIQNSHFCSQFPTEAMLWIKEVELVDSVDDLKSSRSIRGTPGPNFELLDARIAFAPTKSSRIPAS